MKFINTRNGQACLFLTFSLLVASCNPEEFFPIDEQLTGDDAFCYEAKNVASCQEKSDRCQPAYADSLDEQAMPVFLMCIANPQDVPTDGTTSGTDGGTAGGTDGGTTGGTDGGTAGGTDGGTAGGTDGGTAGGTDGGTAGGTDGGTAGGTDGGTAGGTTGDTTGGTDGGTTGGTTGDTTGGTDGGTTGGSTPNPIPTIEDAYESKCQNLDEQYLWIKKTCQKNKVISKTVKVKVCHMTGNGYSHSIVIACSALKAHIKHQDDDYLGSCHD